MATRELRAGLWGSVLLLVAACDVNATTTVKAFPSGGRYDNVQCVYQNESSREIFAIAQWLECANATVVTDWGGTILPPGHARNLISNDDRACRCAVTFDGQPGDIAIEFASGSGTPPSGYPLQLSVCLARAANNDGCTWSMSYDYWLALPTTERPPIVSPVEVP